MTTSTLLVLCAALSGNPPEIVAHRGESADAPENTLAAFKLAWERKVPAIELDVHLSKDGKLVVIHDKDTERTSNVKKVIKDSTWDELKDIDVGAWKDPKFKGEKLCILEDALATIPKGSRCFIEVKVGAEAIPALVKAVRGSGKSKEQLCVISFQEDAVAESKKQLPELPAYYLANFKQDKKTGEWGPPIEEIIATATRVKADGVDLGYKGPVDAAMVKKVRDAGLGLYFWTVDEEPIARKLVKLGADGITTNKGQWLGEVLSKPGK